MHELREKAICFESPNFAHPNRLNMVTMVTPTITLPFGALWYIVLYSIGDGLLLGLVDYIIYILYMII
jgi:hypothetical protein